MGQNKHALHLHKRLHTKHNERVAEFHKQHAIQIENGENGNGLLAKWERYIYFKGRTVIKAIKGIAK
ncbi:hypothetical protein AN960_20275 [Bacillus sp. FJAT-25509]|uniref:hypothetical protein n=1 Tax=Bacillaceae TaxID=186817 RepID=UPI0006FB5C6C|nr:hypothetical protein [Bacillus sp. FJAT-25509]KQL33977.1 hypothetical protein AN960_20275 [Bacillus sp. FJAT-25509]